MMRSDNGHDDDNDVEDDDDDNEGRTDIGKNNCDHQDDIQKENKDATQNTNSKVRIKQLSELKLRDSQNYEKQQNTQKPQTKQTSSESTSRQTLLYVFEQELLVD